MNKKWTAIVAGILDILSSLYLIGQFLYLGLGILEFLPLIVLSVFAALIAFIGGIYAMKRKEWPIALAGSFSAIFTCAIVVMIYYIAKPNYAVPTVEFVRSWAAVLVGISALVLTILSRKEFK